jgi:hypothetical protein
MDLEITLNPPPPVKTRRLLALGYIKYRSNLAGSAFEDGSAAGQLQVHGLLLIDESGPNPPRLPGSKENYG